MCIVCKGAVRLSKVSPFTRRGFLFLVLSFPLAGLAVQTNDTVRLDNSDWWSMNRSNDSGAGIKAEAREFTTSNFRILGISLGDTMFSRAGAKLGKATMVERGDASTGRRQACYVSPNSQNKVHLIFEQGEVDYTFYLFASGPSWEGADRCVESNAISRQLATASGIRLGQTPDQVIALLGKPTKRRDDELVYFSSVTKKTSPEDLKEARQQNPEMNDKDFEESYGHYNLGASIVAKFKDSRLTYLAVSKVESN
jgi:hypothetical protein